MPTMTLSPDSANDERNSIVNASKTRSCAAIDLAERELRLSVQEPGVPSTTLDRPVVARSAETGPAMTEDDTVCVLEVLAEMQRIIDRHLAKTEQRQPKR